MAQRYRARFWNLLRNAGTLLLLGFLGVQVAYAFAIPRITDVVPSLPDWLLMLIGWTNVGLGGLLLISGVMKRRLREVVSMLEDLTICGPFRDVRRPIFGGILQLLIGFGFVLNLVGLLVTALLWCFVAALYNELDDRPLRSRLGLGYKHYRRSTPLLIPHLGRLFTDLFRAD